MVLLLGAGASSGAKSTNGQYAPSSTELASLISEEFLSRSRSDHDLAQIAELAISETSLPEVQQFVAELLINLQPTRAHYLLPKFRWHGLVTTNYDRLIERAYDRAEHNALQAVKPVLHDEDSMEDAQRDPYSVVLLKLHGCLSRPADSSLPFILTPDQYVTHRIHRNHLFKTLREWGSNHTLVAIGHSLNDFDLRQLLLELDALGSSRPRYYLVGPYVSDEERRLWESRRITPLEGTFDDFVRTLDESIPEFSRQVAVDPKPSHPIDIRIKKPVLPETASYLRTAARYIHTDMSLPHCDPAEYYRGGAPNWVGIAQNLDVRRRVADTIMCDVILADESDRNTPFEFYVLLAEAGAGKTTCLQRIAWDATVEDGRLCIYINRQGAIDFDAISDLVGATDRRLFLFIDDAIDHRRKLEELAEKSVKEDLKITVIAAERKNEWNIYCERLDRFVTNVFQLRYLETHEIEQLLNLLETHNSLGYLEPLSAEDRLNELQVQAGRQLLVALLEATQGRTFEEILIDEFEGVQPKRARSLYLTVCILNSLGVPVRAGLISRIHQIPFREFQEKLFEPLEHVVRVEEDWSLRDHVYLARHQLIAQVIFERVLDSPKRRFNEYMRIVGELNLTYDTDRSAFRAMIHGRTINDLFASNRHARAIFDAADQSSPDDSYVLHQRAIHEMNRSNGDFSNSYDLLTRASKLAPGDLTIIHSMAELERKRAETAPGQNAKHRHRRQAMRLARQLQSDPIHGPFGYHTVVKTQLDWLSESLKEPAKSRDDIQQLIRNIERTLSNALALFPGNDYLLASEAEFAGILKDQERARASLQEAFDSNHRSPFIANRLARVYKSLNRLDDAVQVLEAAVSANPSERRLHFAYAMVLRDAESDQIDTMIHHLRHSRSPNRDDTDAEFWYACYLYTKGTIDSISDARAIFSSLGQLRISYHDKVRIRADNVSPDGCLATYTGQVIRREDSFGWIKRDNVDDQVLIHSRNLTKEVWAEIRRGSRLNFRIAFNYRGPIAVDISFE